MSVAPEFVLSLLALLAKHDLCDSVFWNRDLRFFVYCNDFFFWACADGEEITKENLPELEKAIHDCEAVGSRSLFGPLLWCARRRKMRPQDAYYKNLPKPTWQLFDACGEVRACFGKGDARLGRGLA